MKNIVILLFILFPILIISQSFERFGQSDKTYYDNGNLFTEKKIDNENNNTKHIIYFEDGITKLGEFETNSDGNIIMGRSYYENGKIASKDYYDNGKILNTKCWSPYGNEIECKSENGLIKHYYDSGNLQMEGFKINGEWNGSVKMYFEDGNIMGEQNFRNGISTGISKYYYENGMLKFETNDNGRVILMYPNGNVEHQGELRNAIENGLWKYYYENGVIKYSGNWKDGKQHGLWKVFDESGNFKGEIRYNNGNIIE